MAAAGSHSASPRTSSSWLCAKATVSPPPPPPGSGAHLFSAGAGQGYGRGWGRMCGYTTVGAWGFGTDRDLGMRPAWPARRTEVRAPPSLASAQILRGDCAIREAPGHVCQLCPFSQKQRQNPGNGSLSVPSFLAACSLSAPSQPLALPAPLAWGLPGLPPFFTLYSCISQCLGVRTPGSHKKYHKRSR